jgi:HSP20 family molecular chaperone IbpA
MKRMYVALFISAGIIFWAGSILGQQKKSDQMDDRLKLREEIHRRILDKMLRGVGTDQDMFSDMEEMMDKMMSESMSGFESMGIGSVQNFQIDWSESVAGRTLLITPQNPDQQLDINVSNGFIVIKGKSEQKSQTGSSFTQFSNSFNIPSDCDPGKVKMDQKDGKILVFLPFKNGLPKGSKPQEKRIPLPPSEGDVQI